MTTGALVLVSTPIGNLGDLSQRAIEELQRADAIACEDTRHTGRLLKHAGIQARKLMMVNDHNESRQKEAVLARIARGERVAVVTDAGTPGISDPGERLVKAVAAAGYRVEVVPGPSAAISGLVASGLPTGRFVFEGFLPRKGHVRDERLAELAAEKRTIVLFEAPHRVAATITDLAAAMGSSRRIALARELTKLHEEIWRGSLGDAVTWLAENRPRGEYVLVIDGAPPEPPPTEQHIVEALQSALEGGATRRDASHEVAEALGVPKRRVYDLANRL
jgi:16S rRNA (cytidine1402-2'-O)-methyltransferase